MVEIAHETFETRAGFEVDILDLSRTTSEATFGSHAALGDNVHAQGKMIHQISFAAAVAVIVAVLVLR